MAIRASVHSSTLIGQHTLFRRDHAFGFGKRNFNKWDKVSGDWLWEWTSYCHICSKRSKDSENMCIGRADAGSICNPPKLLEPTTPAPGRSYRRPSAIYHSTILKRRCALEE